MESYKKFNENAQTANFSDFNKAMSGALCWKRQKTQKLGKLKRKLFNILKRYEGGTMWKGTSKAFRQCQDKYKRWDMELRPKSLYLLTMNFSCLLRQRLMDFESCLSIQSPGLAMYIGVNNNHIPWSNACTWIPIQCRRGVNDSYPDIMPAPESCFRGLFKMVGIKHRALRYGTPP